MTQPAAPYNVLKMIFCCCKTGCGTACECRRSGLFCTDTCSFCNGNGFFNAAPVDRRDINEENVIESDSDEE